MRKSGFVTQEQFNSHLDKHWQTAHGIWPKIRGITARPKAGGGIGAHASTHEVGGGDLLVFASITDFGTYLDQAVKQASAVSFTGITDTATAATNLAAGTTGQRLGGVVGDIRYNSTLARYEIYPGVWKSIPHVGDAPTAHAASHEKGGGDLISTLANLTVDNLYFGANPLIRQSAGALTFQTNEGVNTDTYVYIKGKGTGDGYLRIFDADDAEYLQISNNTIRTLGATPKVLHIQYSTFTDIRFWAGITEGNPYFYIYGWHVTDVDYIRMRVEADGDGLIEAENNLNILAGGGDINFGDENLTTTGTIAATLFEGNLHWDYITNEPTYYPPEFHWHIGDEIKSDHLVDIDYDPDVHGDDKVFDVLATGAIHGLGNYDWFGTWTVTAGAGCTAEVTVLAGDDKMLTLTDNDAPNKVIVELDTAADHPMVSSVIQFDIRQSTNTDRSWFYLRNSGGAQSIVFRIDNDGNIKYFDGAATTTLCAYAANTWYTIRAHIDCVAGYSVIWVNNVWNCRKALTSLNYINNLYLATEGADSGYTLDINNLKIFNLTV